MRLNTLIAGVPYAVIAIRLRLLMARSFSRRAEQDRRAGVPFNWLRIITRSPCRPTSDAALQMQIYADLPFSATKATIFSPMPSSLPITW
jgi:hypothetical protein